MAINQRVRERIARIEALKQWLDERVREVYTQYCEVFGKKRDGVDDYTIGDRLYISTIWSSHGHSDTDSVELPIFWLYMDIPDRLADMRARKAAEDAQNQKRAEAKRRAELTAALADVERLSRELSGETPKS